MFTIHKKNWAVIRSVSSSQLAWSLFCASQMDPRSQTIDYSAKAGTGAENLVAGVDSPPAFSKKFQWIPLIGMYLSLMLQAQDYFAPLEDCVDFMAKDLERGWGSEFVGKRVGVKVKSKAL